ncbi:MAG: riboflavin biosynthesis protein RibF [Bacteroidia bacterium]|nr:riboflavin biosynthesis protein RibF [Bacteroidia bacterium]
MNVYRSFEEARNIKNPVVTTGSFDGVHIGHKTILKRLNSLAAINNGESVLITFDPHPRKVLYPETAGKGLKLINSQQEKLELLAKAGLDNVIIIRFSLEFSRITSENFVRDYLHGILKAKVVVAGFNHHFGFNQEGDYKQLWGWQEKYNFSAEEIPEQEVENETVSSTKIRKAISEGYIQRANAYLDHYYIVMGKPINYHSEPETGLPVLWEIPLTEECKLLPSPGIYAVSAESGNYYSRAMVIVNPKEGNQPELLTHFFDTPPNGEDLNITMSFHKKIHGAVNHSEPKSVSRILAAREEISELIY